MPTFYEGEPLVSAQQVLKEEEYVEAFFLKESMSSPFARRGVKLAACLTGVALLISLIPMYLHWYSTVYGILCGILFLLFLGGRFYFVQPGRIRARAAQYYRSNKLMQLPEVFTIYRDSMEEKTEKQTIYSYWTDFYACYESRTAFLFVGGMERDLTVLNKENFSPEQTEVLSDHFKETFASRYRKC